MGHWTTRLPLIGLSLLLLTDVYGKSGALLWSSIDLIQSGTHWIWQDKNSSITLQSRPYNSLCTMSDGKFLEIWVGYTKIHQYLVHLKSSGVRQHSADGLFRISLDNSPVQNRLILCLSLAVCRSQNVKILYLRTKRKKLSLFFLCYQLKHFLKNEGKRGACQSFCGW